MSETPAAVRLPTPPVTAEQRAQARSRPNSWLYIMDPLFADSDDVPPFGVAGAYRVDEHGNVAPEFTANPDYRPSPRALGFPEPANELERALQLAVTGYGSDDAVLAALRSAVVFIPANADGSGVALFDEGLDRQAVKVFTSDAFLPADWVNWTRAPLAQLVPALAGRYLIVDDGSPLMLRLPGEAV